MNNNNNKMNKKQIQTINLLIRKYRQGDLHFKETKVAISYQEGVSVIGKNSLVLFNSHLLIIIKKDINKIIKIMNSLTVTRMMSVFFLYRMMS